MSNISRIKAAIEFLKDEKSFSVSNLLLSSKNNVVSVTGFSSNVHLKNITKDIAIEELLEIKGAFKSLIEESTELSEFVKGKKMEYALDYDLGKAAINICREIEGNLVWGTPVS